ncbi:MAG: GTP 3',8-cyclase MoaA [Proteocatella sp.]
MIDNYGRNINYLRVSVTDLCQFRCTYCIPEKGIKQLDHSEILSLEEIYSVIREFSTLGVDKIRFTGGEPLVRKGLLGLIKSVSRLEKIKDIAMTTNGALLDKLAQPLKNSGLHRVNISLDTLNEKKFKAVTRVGELKDVIRGVEAAKMAGLGVKFNVVLMKDFNDDEIEDLINLTRIYDADVRFIELMPIGENQGFAAKHFMSCDEILKKVDLRPMITDDPHAPTRYYKYGNAKGRVGFITAMSSHFCSQCNRIRLTSDGKLKPCLHSNQEIDLKKAIRNSDSLNDVIAGAIKCKPEKHHLVENQIIDRGMSRIGG